MSSLTSTTTAAHDIQQHTAAEIIALEGAALDRCGRGDPAGYLENSAPEVTYFAPYLPREVFACD